MSYRDLGKVGKQKKGYGILFVCTGNLCRSPLAEGYLVKRLRDKNIAGVKVKSAGTIGIDGKPASEGAIRIARENDFDISRHRARALTHSLLQEADLVIVMEDIHREFIAGMDPDAGEKTRLLMEFSRLASPDSPVYDPYGRDYDAYRLAFEQIREGIEGLLEMIQEQVCEEKS